MKVTGAIPVGIMILGGCAEGKRARGQQKYNGYQDYRKGHPVKHAENLNAALVGIDLPSFRPYGEFQNRRFLPCFIWLIKTSTLRYTTLTLC